MDDVLRSTNTLIRSKVVIGDMDAPGANAVVTSIIKNGGWVIALREDFGAELSRPP